MKRALVLGLAACGSAAPARAPVVANAPPAVDYANEACIRAFVDTQPLVHAHHWRKNAEIAMEISRVPEKGGPTEPHYYVFHVEYGEAHDCEAGCFNSHVTGVALSCTRLGWVMVDDYENTDRAKFAMLPSAPVDPMLLDQSWWPAAASYDRFFAWLADNPAVPPATREAAKHPPEPHDFDLEP